MNRLLIPFLALSAGLAALLALCLGPIPIHLKTLTALAAGGSDDPAAVAILELRLPRVVLALLIGATLAQSGAVMQALFRNPLAEPGLVGVSAGAALAAAVVFTWAGSANLAVLPYALPLAAFAGGLAASWAVTTLARSQGLTRMSTLLLAGAAVNAFVAAAVGLIASMADDDALRNFTLWMFGNLGRAGWPEIAVAGPVLLLIALWLPREARALDALLLGEAEALHLGVPVERLKRRVMLLAVLGTGCAVALGGLIGFIGLIVPHAVRLLAGPGHRRLLPASALLGALLLVLADTAARSLHPPAELPVGVLTALVGAPFFMALLLRLRNRLESL
ncbi:MAG: iron ABC transporter permease [Nevskia sp.]